MPHTVSLEAEKKESVPQEKAISVDADTSKKLSDLEALCENKEKRISELLDELEKSNSRINELSLPASSPSLETIQKSKTYIDLKSSLLKAEASVATLNDRQHHIMKRWADTKGSLELAQKTAVELQMKHDRRWKEITGELDEDDGEVTEKDMKGEKEIIMEHKLRQALEAVRMNESTKTSLAESQELIESLQVQVNDWKAKYDDEVSSKKQNDNLSSGVEAPVVEATSKPQNSSRDRDSNYEKMKRDNSKLRKEVQIANANKDATRGKLEVSKVILRPISGS